MKLAVGITTTGDIKTKTLMSLHKLNKKTPYNIVVWEGCNVHQSRENIAMEFLKSDCTHLLFIDSDMVFPEDGADILFKRDRDIIGADYNMRMLPLTSTVKIYDENGKDVSKGYPDGTFECFAVATGFMMIKREVFEKLPHPWFNHEHDNKGNMITGSDMYFCKKAREEGYKIFCDPSIKVLHIGDYLF